MRHQYTSAFVSVYFFAELPAFLLPRNGGENVKKNQNVKKKKKKNKNQKTGNRVRGGVA